MLKIDKPITLKLEHSLISLRKWESKHHKPFMGKRGEEEKTLEEILDYIYCMITNKEKINPLVISCISEEDVQKVVSYIQDPMTATWFSTNTRIGASHKIGEVVTAEIIYYWMISYNVPIELERWHLNQLLTLLRVLSVKNGGDKKMSRKDAATERRILNEQRRAKYKSRG